MYTPFDDITWTIRKYNPPFTPPEVIAPLTDTLAQRIGHSPSPVSHPVFADPVFANSVLADPVNTEYRAPYRLPLRNHDRFRINIADDESVEVVFLDGADTDIKTIWAGAKDAYLDVAFNAVRLNLPFDAKNESFGRHVVISYDGRKGTGGVVRQLSIRFLGEFSISIPTFDLLNLPDSVGHHAGTYEIDG